MRTVSVIMPCFNHGRFIVESVNSVLGQTHEDLELIIVDDCSSDGSWSTIVGLADQHPRIKAVRHQRNQGVSKSRNDGLRAATGEFVAFCDADDIWEAGKLASQVGLLEANPNHALAYCDSRIIDEHGALTGSCFSDLFPPPKASSGQLFRELVKTNFINTQSVLMRRECVKDEGLFDEDLRVVEDWWCWIQLSRHHRFVYSTERLGRYRMHVGSTSVANQRSYCVSRYKVLRRILATYEDLPLSVKSNLYFTMGVDLCDLGRRRVGRRLLWKAVWASIRDVRASVSSCRALRRLVLQAAGVRSKTLNPVGDPASIDPAPI